jgi:hypothetical protein
VKQRSDDPTEPGPELVVVIMIVCVAIVLVVVMGLLLD